MEITKITKHFFIFIFTLAVVFFMKALPVYAYSDYNIISSTTVTADQAKQWAKSNNATSEFVSLADLYYEYAPDHGNVNPAIAYIQSALETGFGNFGGVIDSSYHNPCGLKTSTGGGNYDPNAHQRFSTWDQGVQAHLDHIALYAGASGYPRYNTYDPRHFITIKGVAVTVNSLGGKWAPSPEYGQKIVNLYNSLLSYSNISYSSSTSYSTPVEPSYSQNSANTYSASAKNGWKKENDIWYFYQNNICITGWRDINNTWYYFDKNGKMQTGWITYNGNRYYLYDDGKMLTDWYPIDGDWYFFDGSGAMKTGWISLNDGCYYLYPDSGKMAKDTIIDNCKIDIHGRSKDKSMQKIIVIDPGHNYGGDYGAESTINGVTYSETDLNLKIADKITYLLRNKGYNVIMTRTDNDHPVVSLSESLKSKVSIANNNNAYLFVSIHQNKATPSAHGVEVHFNSYNSAAHGGLSYKLAYELSKAISDNTGEYNRGPKQSNSLYVLKNTYMASVLVECGFISNEYEARNLSDDSYEEKIASAIVDVISRNI
ncbi:N-acetylmuramoyl-L-alanine amidase [Clostridium sp. BJN0001]|uniref:N-acetylmuramoyl-L-alanine amidase n=1 Tax=Clostridium sp. BJN0001 TaxID=2930219 RepID=UPI001FD14AA6|nr:N-acetylmuramoyl-L-alanine amidase [Clostridium sp. BJN0001]